MSLPYINIPLSISSTSNQAFDNCTALVKVVLHEGLQWIGKSAFLTFTCMSLLTLYHNTINAIILCHGHFKIAHH